MRRILLLIIISFTFLSYSFAQGVTSSSMSGKIIDENGEPLIGANVTAVHGPTGTFYGNSTDLDGFYRISNMRTGGPYRVTISYTGYEDFVRENVFLNLGQAFKLNNQLIQSSVQLEEVSIVANRNDVFNGNSTGAETFVGEDQIAILPTVSRSIGDFVRITPQATITEGNDGFSISLNGVNNRFNAIYIDGAVNNDVFGLAGSGTNGGQTGVSPFSVDAIEQFQISLAPFDVRSGGFAGGAINAITRSGSNDFEGSVYTFIRNESLAGKTPTDNPNVERTRLADFSARTTGFRIGGALKKDKIFFFLNGEIQRDEIPLPFNFADYEGSSTQADLNGLENKLLNEFGYDPGTFDGSRTFLDSDKITAKFDFNLSNAHKLSIKHSYVSATNLEGNQSGTRLLRYTGSSEFFESRTNSTSLELNSVFGNKYANNLVIGYTTVRDDRDPNGAEFPYVIIDDGGSDIIFGSEPFSTANLLNQDIFTITNNFEIYNGKHTFTIGTHNEFYSVDNLFLAFNFGWYEYDQLDDFINDEPAAFFQRVFSLRDNVTGDDSQAIASFTGGQLGLYVQDEIQVSDKFNLTAGIRLDVPYFGNTPVNDEFNNVTGPLIEQSWDLRGASVGDFIGTPLMISPRLGFNYDLSGNQTTQLRGGIGIFTSRVPLVWPGGAYNNYGFNAGFTCCFDTVFNPDPNSQPPGDVDLANPRPNGTVDLFAEDFKLPQVLKVNVALDHKLAGGLIANVDAIYNKTLNNVAYQNVNLRPSTTRLTGTGDNRLLYDRRDEIDPTYGRVLLGYNTSEGYTYNFTASITKPFTEGFSGSFAYSYGDSFSIFDGTSSQNSSQWRGLHSVDGRNVDQQLTRSDFSQGSRFIGTATFKRNWIKNLATTISLFYEGQSGRPFTYIYNDNGRLNNEDSRERALLYVPSGANDINLVEDGGRTPQQQWADLDQFIESDDYLSTRRGQYVERNSSRAPFSNVIDLKFLQDFNIHAGGKKHTLQLSIDVFNFTNLLNNSWGRRSFVSSSFQLLDFEGFQDDGTTPEFSFRGVTNNDPAANNIDDRGIQSSRWQMQFGIRYIFK